MLDKNMKLSRVNRLVRLLTTLQSGQNYSVKELTENLNVSRRTVFRDLKDLEAIGVPYYFDSKTGGYSIEQTYYLHPIDLKLNEALSVLMLIHNARKMIPFPFHRSALMAGLKIENNLPNSVKQFCKSSLNNISFKKGRTANCDDLEKKFCDIQNAIRNKQPIKMCYESLYDKGYIELDLLPYHLIYNHRAWYLIGHSGLHEEVRTFKLMRIKNYTILNKKFNPPKNFDPNEHFGRAWAMIPEGRLWNIKLRFDAMVAKNVSEVRWHDTQSSHWNTDGTVDLEFRIDGLNEISWWVLGYGDKVKVIKPLQLRKKLLEISKAMVKNYEE